MADIDVGMLSEAINDKADRDINNLTTSGYAKGSGLGMPSGRYVNLTLGASGSYYTAPANGWIIFSKAAQGSSSQYISCYNEVGSLLGFQNSYDNQWLHFIVPVIKDYRYRIDYNASGNTVFFRFVYAEGEQ